MNQSYLLTIVFSLVAITAVAKNSKVRSAVYEWTNLEVQKNEAAERMPILKGSTDGFEMLEVYAKSIAVGEVSAVQKVEAFEQLIIIKKGTLEMEINCEKRMLRPGSIAVVLAGDTHGIRNTGSIMATYFILMWQIKNTGSPHDTSSTSAMVNWAEVKFESSAKGGRRNIIRQPTSMLAEFEMHTTTLDEGMKSHDPHTHVEEEIILVRYGQVEELIDGFPHPAGPGSVIFLGSNIPHGIRNIGEGPCEYYAFKWKLR